MNEMLMRQRDNMVPKQKRESYGPKGGQLSAEISGRIQKQRGSGKPLSAEMLRSYSEHFKRNMKDVRVHDDAESAELNEQLNSRAFTVGNDIFLYQHTDMNDREVMTHELTHVAQNDGNAPSGSLTLGAVDTPQEHEASAGTARSSAPSGTVQRWGWGIFKKIKNWFSNLFGGKKNEQSLPDNSLNRDQGNLIGEKKDEQSRGFGEDSSNRVQKKGTSIGQNINAAKVMPAKQKESIRDGWEVIDNPIPGDVEKDAEANSYPADEDDVSLVGALDSMDQSSPLIESDPSSSKLIEDNDENLSMEQIDDNFDLDMETKEVPGFKGELVPEGMLGNGLSSEKIDININYDDIRNLIPRKISELESELSDLESRSSESYEKVDLEKLESIKRDIKRIKGSFADILTIFEPDQKKKILKDISSLEGKATKLRKRIVRCINEKVSNSNPDIFEILIKYNQYLNQ